MHHADRDMNVDELLQEAASSFGDPGPDSGLSRRILIRLEAKHAAAQRRVRWFGALGLSAVAASLWIFLFSMPHKPALHATTSFASPHMAAEAAPAQVVRHVPRRTARPGRSVAQTTALPVRPKRPLFPTPLPPSGEEQALRRFAVTLTRSQYEALIEADARAAEPLHVAAISIAPISLDDPPLGSATLQP
jgi:hypothetical protein